MKKLIAKLNNSNTFLQLLKTSILFIVFLTNSLMPLSASDQEKKIESHIQAQLRKNFLFDNLKNENSTIRRCSIITDYYESIIKQSPLKVKNIPIIKSVKELVNYCAPQSEEEALVHLEFILGYYLNKNISIETIIDANGGTTIYESTLEQANETYCSIVPSYNYLTKYNSPKILGSQILNLLDNESDKLFLLILSSPLTKNRNDIQNRPINTVNMIIDQISISFSEDDKMNLQQIQQSEILLSDLNKETEEIDNLLNQLDLFHNNHKRFPRTAITDKEIKRVFNELELVRKKCPFLIDNVLSDLERFFNPVRIKIFNKVAAGKNKNKRFNYGIYIIGVFFITILFYSLAKNKRSVDLLIFLIILISFAIIIIFNEILFVNIFTKLEIYNYNTSINAIKWQIFIVTGIIAVVFSILAGGLGCVTEGWPMYKYNINIRNIEYSYKCPFCGHTEREFFSKCPTCNRHFSYTTDKTDMEIRVKMNKARTEARKSLKDYPKSLFMNFLGSIILLISLAVNVWLTQYGFTNILTRLFWLLMSLILLTICILIVLKFAQNPKQDEYESRDISI